MKLLVHLRGNIHAIAQRETVAVSGINNKSGLLIKLAEQVPQLKGYPIVVAINEEIAHGDVGLKQGDFIEVFGAQAGG